MADSHSARPLRVFLCHASGDKPAVRELYQRLRADSIDAWLDEEKLLPGQDWQREIPKAVRASDIVIVCLSRGSINKAGYVQKEIKFALDVADEQPEDTIFLIPLKLEECDVPERLSRWQWVNLFSPNGYERLMLALRARATSLEATIPLTPTSSSAAQGPAHESTVPSVSNVSGGVNIDGQQVSVGKDVVGRDKAPTASVQVWGGVEFVRIPAGKFLMGSKEDNPIVEFEQETPQHLVEILYDYWIARYPITNNQFAAFIGAKHYETTAEKEGGYLFEVNRPKKGIDWRHPLGPQSTLADKDDHPVTQVSWYDAVKYCEWLSTILRGELREMTLRLPTEAEWEKAARGASGDEWPWGNEFDRRKCNSGEGGEGGTTPVNAYSPQGNSPYGVADMVGNVWEWCHSRPKPYPYQFNDGREDEGPGGKRILRGGSFHPANTRETARCARRFWYEPPARSPDIGFRIVVSTGLI